MKNKEVEEILNVLKHIVIGRATRLTCREADKLLSYTRELENKYNKALEILSDYNMPCEYAKPIIPDEYCEENCEVSDEIYKTCWNKHIELTLKGGSK